MFRTNELEQGIEYAELKITLIKALSSSKGKAEALKAQQRTQSAIASLNKARQVDPMLLQEPVTL